MRWGRIGALGVAAALTVSLAGGAARAGAAGSLDARPAATRTYTVQAGDTVWGIAKRLAGPQADPRPLVDRIIAQNDLRATGLLAGQVLVLPSS